ncbi:MAG: GNAT family N-acetyltransferase [Bacteroidia bacterium]|nr:GNAT family N-acetyltransferase [Bacteroidia bacterium]NNF30588.1 GNAT family N-acetyltransferase [Flavobacteriaceae bacterium]MBT8275307.1 GNAT family N-acetyltransferase [Bacteroidia bacterium]NNJ81607.1 GNAT family N-acetyltransferase [Flavobacteriaceae bacterium]NNK53065.1 GNAT family N-acetyltransferase [Flavobacteriaceae bacterium]
MSILTTDRLQIRPYTLGDAAFVLELLNSPEWMANIGDRGIKTLTDAENYIETKYLPQYSEYGYGAYVTEKIGTDEIVGTCGIYNRPDLDHPDIGFALLPQYAKQGYAFEAAYAVKEYAKNTLKFETLYGITLPSNTNSIRLLEKLGFNNIDRIRIEGDPEELLLFSISF